MVAAMQTGSDEGQKLQKDMINILRGVVPPPSRVGGVMYQMGYYVNVIKPELHTRFLEALLAVCKEYEQRSETMRQTVSFYASPYCKCIHDFILLFQMFT